MNRKSTLWSKIKAYKLQTQFWIMIIMLIIFILSLLAYQIPELRQDEVMANILLALFTSLLVTVFTMLADIIVSYHEHKTKNTWKTSGHLAFRISFRTRRKRCRRCFRIATA